MTEQGKRNWRWFRWVFHAVMLTGIVVLLILNFARQSALREQTRLETLGTVPEFALTERTGQSVSLGDLRGKVWIADFIFTRCAGPCPLMTAHMARLQETMKDARDLRLISFSVDPEYDTPKVLSEYAQKFGADKEKWLFLTGNKSVIYDLANQGFRVGATENPEDQRQPDEDAILHSTSFVLVDRKGRIRGYYNSDEAGALQKLVEDARRLLRGKSS